MAMLSRTKVLSKLLSSSLELLNTEDNRSYNRRAFEQLMKLYALIKHKQFKKAYVLVYSLMSTNVRDEVPGEIIDFIDTSVRN